MGQAISRTKPRRSHQPTNASQNALHQGISRPEPPRPLTHISELIDIDQLIRQRSSSTDLPPDNTLFTEDPTTTDDGAAPPVMIQSPSGHILSPQQYLERPDRVMTLEERKIRFDRIRKDVFESTRAVRLFAPRLFALPERCFAAEKAVLMGAEMIRKMSLYLHKSLSVRIWLIKRRVSIRRGSKRNAD